jgi:hypothetical protein
MRRTASHRPSQPPVRHQRLLHRVDNGVLPRSPSSRPRPSRTRIPATPIPSTSRPSSSTSSTPHEEPILGFDRDVITYDDSDGWYDHQMPSIVNPSTSSYVDVLNGATASAPAPSSAPDSSSPRPRQRHRRLPVLGRCGYGTRIPLLVISPWAARTTSTTPELDQTSVIRFIEDNWLGGKRSSRPWLLRQQVARTPSSPCSTSTVPAEQRAARKLILDPHRRHRHTLIQDWEISAALTLPILSKFRLSASGECLERRATFFFLKQYPGIL